MQSALDQNINKDQFRFCTIQNSDSGADLSEHVTEKQQNIAESTNQEIQYFCSKSKLDNAWEKYWSLNGESIIWKSWIEKYGAYINPNYLEQNSFPESLNLGISEILKENTGDLEFKNDIPAVSTTENIPSDKNDSLTFKKSLISSVEKIPDLKISTYSSCNNLSEVGESTKRNSLLQESDNEDKILKSNSFGSYTSYEKVKYNSSEDDRLKIDTERVRSRCSNTNLSVKSIANTTVTTDSMTNVTKITLSSLDLSCECESVKSSSLLSTSSDSGSV